MTQSFVSLCLKLVNHRAVARRIILPAVATSHSCRSTVAGTMDDDAILTKIGLNREENVKTKEVCAEIENFSLLWNRI